MKMKNRTIKSMAKRLAALAMAAVCTFSLTQVPAVKAAEVLEAGDYVVPIKRSVQQSVWGKCKCKCR